MQNITRYRFIIFIFVMILIFSGCHAPTVELCEKCNGAKNFVCEKCNGSGSLLCPVEDCEYGKIGKCEYCEEDKGVYNCSNCDDGIIRETCEVCSGKGTTINQFTQQTSTCEECNGVKEWSYTCKYCAGCGLICHYCRLNMTKYPNPAYKVYYEDCKQCSSTGYIQCDECLGMKTSPCSKCSVDEYNLFIEDFNKKKEAEQKKNNAIDEVLTLLSGKILTIETLKQAEDLINNFDFEWTEKDRLLKDINTVQSLVSAEWEVINGEHNFFGGMSEKNPDKIISNVMFGSEKLEFYIRFNPVFTGTQIEGRIFYLKSGKDFFMEYSWYGNKYKVFLQESGTLLFEKYGSGGKTVLSCELKQRSM